MQPFLVLLLIQPMLVGDSVFGAADGAVIVGAVVSAAVVNRDEMKIMNLK